MSINRTLRVALLGGLSLVLAGCAGLGAPQPPEQIVRQLATQRWQALVSRNFEKAYEFAVPSYRQLHDIDYYRGKRQSTPVKWLAAEVSRVDCEAEKCLVRIQLESKPMVAMQFRGTITTGLDETWVLEAGKWWMFETL